MRSAINRFLHRPLRVRTPALGRWGLRRSPPHRWWASRVTACWSDAQAWRYQRCAESVRSPVPSRVADLRSVSCCTAVSRHARRSMSCWPRRASGAAKRWWCAASPASVSHRFLRHLPDLRLKGLDPVAAASLLAERSNLPVAAPVRDRLVADTLVNTNAYSL